MILSTDTIFILILSGLSLLNNTNQAYDDPPLTEKHFFLGTYENPLLYPVTEYTAIHSPISYTINEDHYPLISGEQLLFGRHIGHFKIDKIKQKIETSLYGPFRHKSRIYNLYDPYNNLILSLKIIINTLQLSILNSFKPQINEFINIFTPNQLLDQALLFAFPFLNQTIERIWNLPKRNKNCSYTPLKWEKIHITTNNKQQTTINKENTQEIIAQTTQRGINKKTKLRMCAPKKYYTISSSPKEINVKTPQKFKTDINNNTSSWKDDKDNVIIQTIDNNTTWKWANSKEKIIAKGKKELLKGQSLWIYQELPNKIQQNGIIQKKQIKDDEPLWHPSLHSDLIFFY